MAAQRGSDGALRILKNCLKGLYEKIGKRREEKENSDE
jgi:hypothetical protein